MPPLEPFGQGYLRLTLEIHKHIDGYIDAYYGPEALRAAVNAAPPRAPADLLGDVQRLQDAIPTADPARAAYLTATLRAIECTVRMLRGEAFDYLDEVYQIYDIRPRRVEESRFEAAHRDLDEALPGQPHVTLAERLATWRKDFEIDAGRALELLELARAETRRRTAAFIPLPDDESVEVKLTSNQPWSAYNWYLGNGRSLIEFDSDMPFQATALLGTFAHEGYPGHHTEHMLKEIALFRARGYAEQAVMLLHSPSAVIAEGIATTALDIIFPDDSHHEWNVEVMLPAAGLPVEAGLAERLQRAARASEALRYVNGNAAILYHTGRLDKAGTIDYMRTYGLATAERAAKSFSFITHPLYRSYPFTYSVGHDLIAATPDPVATFRRLLTEQVLPSELAN
jgi:hypothetical protein